MAVPQDHVPAVSGRAGGHAAVRDRILEDLGLARLITRAGGRIALADGSALATCRMYGSWRGKTTDGPALLTRGTRS